MDATCSTNGVIKYGDDLSCRFQSDICLRDVSFYPILISMRPTLYRAPYATAI